MLVIVHFNDLGEGVKAKRGDYCSVTRARRGTEEREELISQGEEACSKDGDFLSQKGNEI